MVRRAIPTHSTHLTLLIACALVIGGAIGCQSGGESKTAGGLMVEADAVHGPMIVFNPLSLPVPEVPFPNDLSLTVDEESASGVSWNISTEQKSFHRSHIRRLLNKVDGFGPFAPVFVSFDGPLDLSTVTEASVMIVNIEPGHPRLGERVPLDLGRGYFPTSFISGQFFGQDPNAMAGDLLYPVDNVIDADGDGEPERVNWYETSSNTLVLRPVMPLAQDARHAVLITRDVMGLRTEGDKADDPVVGPVRSPFPFKAHAAQAAEIRRALEIAELDGDDLAFGWTYTTADLMRPMQTIRDGIYGKGPLARMADIAPSGIKEVRNTSILHDADGSRFPEDPHDSPYILQAQFLQQLLTLVGQIQGDSNFGLSFDYVDYLVFGSLDTPDLRTGKRREFTINPHTGTGEIRSQEVPFLVSVPKATEFNQPPFPVMFYFHGTGTSRMESLAIADAMARQGVAIVAFDEVGHGPLIEDIPRLLEDNPDVAPLVETLAPVLANILVPERVNEFRGQSITELLPAFEEIGLFAELAVHGRNEDIDGDGVKDIAEAFFSPDPFIQCASFRQDIVDLLQLVRTFRQLDPDDVPDEALKNPAEASYEKLWPYFSAGDFNADGVLDIGGPDVPFGVAGTSLGGFHSVIAAAVEPEITTATPIVAGGGFTDIMVRSDLKMITRRIFLEVFGTVIVGCPDADGNLWISVANDAEECRTSALEAGSFAQISAVEPGAKLVLSNLDNGEVKTGRVNDDGGFAINVESDRGDRLHLVIEGDEAHEFEVESPWDGSGYERNTADFRRIVGTLQHVLDACDPVNFARQLFWEPPPGHPPTNVLFLNAVGDDTVPISTGVVLALAAGVFGTDRKDWEPWVHKIIDAGVMDYADYDIDDLLGDNPEDMPAIGLAEPVESKTGVSSVRFADVHGKHEWIAGYDKFGFQAGYHSQHVVTIFHRCEGRLIYDDDPECLQDRDCELLEDVSKLEGCED